MKHSPNTGEKKPSKKELSAFVDGVIYGSKLKTKPSQQEMCECTGIETPQGMRYFVSDKCVLHRQRQCQPPKSSEWEDGLISDTLAKMELEFDDHWKLECKDTGCIFNSDPMKKILQDALSQQQKEVEERVRREIREKIDVLFPHGYFSEEVGSHRQSLRGVREEEYLRQMTKEESKLLEAVLTSIEEKGGRG